MILQSVVDVRRIGLRSQPRQFCLLSSEF